jgi:hypothetical protein
MHQSFSSRYYRFFPVLLGAGVLAATASFKAAISIVLALITDDWHHVGLRLLMVPVAAAGGAVGGLVYVYLGAPLRRVPVVGPYLAGIVTLESCFATFALLFERIEPGKGLPFVNLSDRLILLLGTLVAGVIFGHVLRDA